MTLKSKLGISKIGSELGISLTTLTALLPSPNPNNVTTSIPKTTANNCPGNDLLTFFETIMINIPNKPIIKAIQFTSLNFSTACIIISCT